MTDSNQQPMLSKGELDSVIALYSNGQYQEAINQIKVLNEAYPNVPLLFNLVGACYKALGQLLTLSQIMLKPIKILELLYEIWGVWMKL